MIADVGRTALAYDEAFAAACAELYPAVAVFENRMGYAIDRTRLEEAARVLACPLKANPPHWQHGRVIYAAVRRRCDGLAPGAGVTGLDVGTAKGFSALGMCWAIQESCRIPQVSSVDVIDPAARVARNTVAELDGLLTLRETLAPWPEAKTIAFLQSTGVEWLQKNYSMRVHVAFVDGKHTGEVVRQEGKLLAKAQESGDLTIFDDVQIPGVSVAVASLHEWYRIEYLEAGPRQYAIGWRR